MVSAYIAHYGLQAPEEQIRAEALEWAITRASRSGRAAYQYIQDLAGRLGQKID
jgi:predicted AAA+ superfamily ATPase